MPIDPNIDFIVVVCKGIISSPHPVIVVSSPDSSHEYTALYEFSILTRLFDKGSISKTSHSK